MSSRVKPGKWTYTVGEPPLQLTAYERKDRGLAIYTRVWDGTKIRDKQALMPSIRDARGRIDPELELEAQTAVIKRHKAKLAGLDEDEYTTGPMTLRAGFRRLLHPKKGKYVGRSSHITDVKSHAKKIMRVLGPDLLWEQVQHSHYRKLWRALAAEYKGGDTYGLRQAEVILGVLQSAARWLQAEGMIKPGDALPAPGWKQTMGDEWAEIVGAPPPEPHQPRYTIEESRRLWAALPEADPRLWLAMEIGAELRLGQVFRCRRSDLVCDDEGEPESIRVHGRGKKLGELVVLTPEQAATVTHHLTEGYLRELEAAYQEGQIPDYHLFPAGRLLYWRNSVPIEDGPVAQLKNADAAVHVSGVRNWWRKLEEAAGVERVPGRRWYGMRRLQSDLAEDVESDARVLNRLGGWKHTSTREHYQEKGRTKIHREAAEVRRKIRPRKDLEDTEREGEK